MEHQQIQTSAENSPGQTTKSPPLPFAEVQQNSQTHATPEELENEAFSQNQFEALGLQLKHSNITPAEQARLGVLQAKMADFWAERMARAQAQPNLLDVPIRSARPAQRIEPTGVLPNVIQAKASTIGDFLKPSAEPRPHKTGLPNVLQTGMENLSGYSLDHVRVHYNSPKPAQFNALAYTRGPEIHVAPGQEKHLPHEAWHVVQQAQGRVRPTMQLKGGTPVNHNRELEQEADLMGAKAVGVGQSSAPLRPRPQLPAAQGDVIQRAIGFEFETGWFVDNIPIEGHGNDDDLEPRQPEPFKKKESVSSATFPGFRMEADEAEDGRSEIEFVVRPPIEESFRGLEQLQQVMKAIVQVGEKLKQHYNAEGQSFPLSLVTGVGLDNYTLVTPRRGDPELKAGPQATTGLDLSVVPELVGLGLKQPPPLGQPKFRGFLTLVRQYLERGTAEGGGTLSYPKMIAEPLLARTNFVKLFQLVEDDVQTYYLKRHPEKWVDDVLTAIGLPKIADVDILARGVVDDQNRHVNLIQDIMDTEKQIRQITKQLSLITQQLDSATDSLVDYKPGLFADTRRKLQGLPSKAELDKQHESLLAQKLSDSTKRDRLLAWKSDLEKQKRALEQYAGFTVRDWLNGLLEGQDRLSTIPDAESLGEFGSRTERVGPKQEMDVGIFEYRGAQRDKIPLTEWPGFADRFFQTILKLHGHSQKTE